MKSPLVNLALVLSVAAASSTLRAETNLPAPPVAAAPMNAPEAKIQFATPVYDFGKVVAGGAVNYEFVFTNAGDGLLEISGVHTSCGCTTAGNWTQKVEPGKTGVIPIQFNSGNYNGPVVKTVTVNCNDKSQPVAILQIKGTVWKPIEVNPQTAVLNVVADSQSNAPALVRILSNEEQPVTLSNPESNNRAFAAELKTVQPGKEFQLVISAVLPLSPGNVQGQITLKTSSTNVPAISVTAVVVVQPAVEVLPARIMLPPGPISKSQPHTISIRNNAAAPLTLSEPVVMPAEGIATNVDVQMKEVEPGRRFTLTLTFPTGFEIAPGQNVELSVKSSHPQFQIIKVAIQQAQRRVPPPVQRGPLPPVPGNQPAPPPRPAGAQ